MKILIQLVFIGLSVSVIAQSHYPGQHKGKIKLNDTKNVEQVSFDLRDVQLLDSRFTENMERESEWIMSLTINRLLHSFRTNAGVYSGKEGGYMTVDKLGGWESLDVELRGHSIGHILSGLSLLHASTGKEKYRAKGDSLVDGLVEVQQALGKSGYLSAYPENLINRNIRGESVWAPWYTLHKLFSGLVDQYLYSDNEQALEIVKGMANWAYEKLEPLTEEQRQTLIRNEFGGINDSFYTLYSITDNPQHKFLAEFFYHEDVLDPLAEKEDILNKKHANTYIPKLVGLIRGYELEGSEKKKGIPEFFWNTVVDHHTFVTGSNSDQEKFFEPDQISQHLTGYTGESCNVYNMLKLTKHLFLIDPQVSYLDYYEKALFNHILGQQDPETGMISYFLPMKPGSHKVYSTPEDSFWCCVGTGFENHAKYGEFIYSHGNDELFVNLFIPSKVDWEEKNFVLIQNTQFPKSETVTFTVKVSSSTHLPVNIRYPSWTNKNAAVKINGANHKISANPGEFIQLSQRWNDGDIIEVTFPMEIELKSTPDDSNVVAITYGPVVLGARLGTAKMQKPAPYSNPELYNDYYTYDYSIPEEITNELILSKTELEKKIKITDEDLNFLIQGEDILLSPIYDIHRERYNVYWNLN